MIKVTGAMATNLQSAFAEPWAYTCGELLVGSKFWAQSKSDRPDTRHIHIISSPSAEEHPLRLVFLLSFLAARQTLYIATSYFVPDRRARRAVCERARQGVDVRILVPGRHTDAKPLRLAGRRYYEQLLQVCDCTSINQP
jgi:cardiolipin synthase